MKDFLSLKSLLNFAALALTGAFANAHRAVIIPRRNKNTKSNILTKNLS
jgi:hypothetical protein